VLVAFLLAFAVFALLADVGVRPRIGRRFRAAPLKASIASLVEGILEKHLQA
jgi:hypothetical protein